MFNSVQNELSLDHRGVQRMENAVAAAHHLGQRLVTTRGLPGLLLTAGLATLAVVADQIITTWADGQLLLAWVVLWAVLLGAIALFAEVAFGWSASMEASLSAWAARARSNAADEQTWAVALSDPRCMADLQAARWRTEVHDQAAADAPAAAFAASH
ncbi:MAG: hypothetical protein LH632_19990 [Rhodoferax sp.]|nr:hypothetical protein [Rhodoferax sp.]